MCVAHSQSFTVDETAPSISTGFGECTITEDSEYATFDRLKYDFEGRHSYMLVKSKNLPPYVQHVCVERVNTQRHDGSDSSEEERSIRGSKDDDDEDEEEDSEEQDGHHRLRKLKIHVYNHTVEFKKNRKVVVSSSRTFASSLFIRKGHLAKCATVV